MAVPELEQVGLKECFEAMVFRDDLGALKPDPQGLQAILERLGLAPGAAVYIGDGPVDVQVARRAGTSSAAALWGTLDERGVLAEAPEASGIGWRRRWPFSSYDSSLITSVSHRVILAFPPTRPGKPSGALLRACYETLVRGRA